ncbi:nudC domain-containing protein 3 isoform X3 [Camelus ferus]|uniref:NudC domain-containing protein 3 n=1 Tax=Camelus ferus TaxID=419612 RepID=A0A8B8TD99_CAMFR|nr:nudC domain-containing protein 3 isoform X3 [Camelus ferus]
MMRRGEKSWRRKSGEKKKRRPWRWQLPQLSRSRSRPRFRRWRSTPLQTRAGRRSLQAHGALHRRKPAVQRRPSHQEQMLVLLKPRGKRQLFPSAHCRRPFGRVTWTCQNAPHIPTLSAYGEDWLRRQEQFQRNPDSYNGAVRENYTWSQDYTDLELKVPVPKHVVKGKQVSVVLSSSSIRVAVLEENGERVLVEGKFTHKINTESSLWSLEPGRCVLVSLNKVGEYWWSAVLEGEEHIDIDKINKERSMATVDEEEHAVLDRLTFDYRQKLQGKPQSHELTRQQQIGH